MGKVKEYYWDEINSMYSPDIPYDVTFYAEELEAYEVYDNYTEAEEDEDGRDSW